TFGTMAARAAVRDVGRVLGVPLSEVDRIAKMVPMELGITLERALEGSSELKEIYRTSAAVKELLDTARAIEGMPRHASTHAAGIVISQEPLTHYLPLQKSGEAVTTQYPMQAVEELGLLKMDLLGLRTLTVIGHACAAIRANRGHELDLENLPLDDKPTYKLLATGESSGIFQLESSGMRAILKELKPERFEDIIALVALYRPGPLGSGMVEDYIRRKHGAIPVSYLHPSLEPILKDTYGVILYQEQVMRIASELAGFSLGQADLLRRAMGKKQPEVLAAQRQRFLEGASARGIPADTAARIFELMEYFAGYGFNASHSAAYALVAYQTAYLKAHYPAELMAALLSSVGENFDKMASYLGECQRLGIKVLPPDVNQSGMDFTVSDGHIRFGLAAIKNVGRAAVEAILLAREQGGPFKSLLDFCVRVDSRQVNKRVLESLIRCGAFNSLAANRRQLLVMLDTCLEIAAQRQEDRRSGQVSLLDLVPTEISEPVPPQLDDFSPADILVAEKELLGFYLSGHPLEPYKELLSRRVSHSLSDLAAITDGSQVAIGGLARNLRRIITRKGNPMAYLTLEDFSSQVEVVLFPRVYSQGRSWLAPDQVVLVHGHISKQEEEVQVLADRIEPLAAGNEGRALPQQPGGDCLYLKLSDKRQIREVQNALSLSPGCCQVYVYLAAERRTFALDRKLWVEPTAELITGLARLLGGHDRVKLVSKKG
ncbi:MAG: DNA polymerase III subunit alpha, partial [Clostridia bacterium]|nr:DNA polymerase III subunit alpha [Clostridia bacterium]